MTTDVIIDREAAGRALFVETYAGTLTLLPEWEDQPRAFRSDLCDRAERVAMAAVHLGASRVPE